MLSVCLIIVCLGWELFNTVIEPCNSHFKVILISSRILQSPPKNSLFLVIMVLLKNCTCIFESFEFKGYNFF